MPVLFMESWTHSSGARGYLCARITQSWFLYFVWRQSEPSNFVLLFQRRFGYFGPLCFLYFILIQHFVWIVVTYTQRKMCSAAGGKYLTELRLKQSAFMPSISVYLLGIPFFYSSKSPDYACWSVWSSSFSITWVAELFPYPARELSLSEN